MDQLKEKSNVVDAISNSVEDSFNQIVNMVTNGESNITIIELPQKGSPSEFDVCKFTKFYLSDIWVSKAKKDGISYPNEFFIVTQIHKDLNGNPESINIIGSMGGGYNKIPWNTPNLIKQII